MAASEGNIGAAIWLLLQSATGAAASDDRHDNGHDNREYEMSDVTRRNFLGTAAVALAAAPVCAHAEAPAANAAAPGIYRYKIGSYELTALYDGIWYRPINAEFIRNAPFGEVEQALDAAFMPHDKLATPFTTCSG